MRRLGLAALAWCAALAAGCDGSAAVPAPGASGSGTPPPPGAGGLVITSVTPGQAPSAGGTAVTILGGGFQAGAVVAVGGQLVTTWTVNPPGLITFTAPRAPAGVVGAQSVQVQNPGGALATLANAFTWTSVAVAATGTAMAVEVDADVGASDVVHVAWREVSPDGTHVVRAARSTDGGRTFGTATTFVSAGGAVSRPRVGAGGGSVLVTWNQTVGTTETCQRAYSLDNGATWSTAAALVSNSGRIPDADVAVDGTGRACVAFRLNAAPVAGGTPVPIRALSGAVNSAFTTAVTLASGGVAGAPAVAADGTGIMLVVFASAPLGGAAEIYSSRSTDGGATFATGVQITHAATAGVTPLTPHVDLRGTTAWLGWFEDGVDRFGQPVTAILAGASTDGGASWSTAAPALPGAAGAVRSALTVAVGGNGTLTVAWGEARAGAVPEVYSARSINGGTSWASLVARSGTSAASVAPAVAAGSGALSVHAFADPGSVRAY